MHAIQDHVKTVDHAIWNHYKIMCVHASKDILVSWTVQLACVWHKLKSIFYLLQENIARNKIFVHHHHVIMVARASHYLVAILNAIAQRVFKAEHAQKMLKNAIWIPVNMVEHAEIHLDLISEYILIYFCYVIRVSFDRRLR